MLHQQLVYKISSNSNLINTNVNISPNTHLINNLTSTITTNFNNLSSTSNLLTGLNSTINSHITAISDLHNGGSFNEADYYNKASTNDLLSEKVDTSILNNALIHNITTTSTFKIAEFENYNYYHELCNNYIDTSVHGSLTSSTMFLNQRGFRDVEINNSSTFQHDKIVLNQNTRMISSLQVSGLVSCSSILDIAGSDARCVLQSNGLSGLITGNTNTTNSIITIKISQDTSLGQKLDKIDTNAQSIAGASNFSGNTNLRSDFNMLTTGSIICNQFKTTPPPGLGLQMTFQMFNREFNTNRDGRIWMSGAGGQWETQIGDANVGRVWVKDKFGLGAVGVNGYVLNCAGQARFTSAVQFVGTDNATSLNNGSCLNFNNNGSIRRYTLDAIKGLYMAHNDFVAVGAGDISNASNLFFMCDDLVKNKPVDVLGNICTNADVNCDNVSIDTGGKLTIDTKCELHRYVSAFSSVDIRNTDANSSIRFICGDPPFSLLSLEQLMPDGLLTLLLLML